MTGGGGMQVAPVGQRPVEGPGGSIYDLGYRGYEGPRLGRRAAVTALLVHSVRTAYGLGRSARSKALPVGLVLAAILPSLLGLGIIALVTQLGRAGEAIEAISPIRYSTLFPFIAVLVFLFSSSQAPELFGRDQRAGVLPLYFSRATSRLDYAAARVLGLYLSLRRPGAGAAAAPARGTRPGRARTRSTGWRRSCPRCRPCSSPAPSSWRVVGSISAATAALTPRRSYATVAIIGIFLIPNIAASLLVELGTGWLGQVTVLLSPADVLDGVNAFLFDVQPDNPSVARPASMGPCTSPPRSPGSSARWPCWRAATSGSKREAEPRDRHAPGGRRHGCRPSWSSARRAGTATSWPSTT